MDLEFDLFEQPSAQSDIFTYAGNELIWKRIHIENLPHEILLNIMKFLDIRDLFYTLNVCSRDFFTLISLNQNFRKILFKSILKACIGFQLPQNSDISDDIILKTLQQPSLLNQPIPFYGYATNGGFDQFSEFWIDTAFIKGLWAICSKEGTSNVNIAGSTIADPTNLYNTYLKNHKSIEDTVCKMCHHIKYNYQGEQFPFNYVKRTFYKFGLDEFEDVQKLYRIECMALNQNKVNHEQMIGLVKISTDLFQKTSLQKKIYLPVHEKVIEDNKTLLCDKTVNILTGVQISREGYFSCPVRTIMIFGSNKRIQVDKNDELDYYDNVNYDAKLEQIIHKKNLKVIDTNVHILRSKSKYFDDQTEFKFAIFSNQQQQTNDNFIQEEDNEQNLIPIAWVQFTTSYIEYICLQFRRMNYYNCKHVVVKLIDSENRIKEQEKQCSPNIDFNYIQFKGLQMKLN